MPSLQIDNLSFAWSEREEDLFGPISAEFVEGQITALLGPNGTGKSTLLNVLAQRIPATGGSIRVGNKRASLPDFNYMLQHPDRLLFRHLSLLQNIQLTKTSSAITTVTQDDIRIFFPDPETLKRYPWQCSIGQRQRAVLLRAILDMPAFAVTLLDEPFSSISRDSKRGIYDLVRRRLGAAGCALVFVTHDLSEACILADAAVILSDGKCDRFDVSAIHDEQDFLGASSLRDQLQRAMLSDTARDHDRGYA